MISEFKVKYLSIAPRTRRLVTGAQLLISISSTEKNNGPRLLVQNKSKIEKQYLHIKQEEYVIIKIYTT